MRSPLTLAVAQPRCTSFEVAANAREHAELVRDAEARVVAFPELSLTGYELDAEPIDASDPRLVAIVDACAASGSTALAGAPVRTSEGGAYIGMLRVDTNGVDLVYRKRWLGDVERTRFVPGDGPSVIEVDGWRLGLAICKDTGIPQHDRETAAMDIDVYVAGVVHADDKVPEQESRAVRIARTHGCYVAISSFAGHTGGGYERTAGTSAIWSPDGDVVARTRTAPGAMARATLEPLAGRA